MTTTHETTKPPKTPPTAKATKATTERDWFDQYLEFVHRIEAPMVRTTARMAGLVAEYVPERPTFLASLPKVHDVMTTGITLRKRLVDEQTRFARQLMKAMDPMLVRVDTVHVEPVRPGAPKERTAARREHERAAHVG